MAASIGSEDIGLLCKGPSMLDWIEAQGETRGPYSKGSPGFSIEQAPRKKAEMRFEGIRILERLCLKSAFHSRDRRDLEGIRNTLLYQRGWGDSVYNPANIEFENPMDWTGKGTVLGSTEPIYGHYRTEDYEDNREEKVSKDFPEGQNVPAVNSTWYSEENLPAATPPVWQALFGDGTVEPFRTRGLLHVVLEGVRLLDSGIEIAIPSVRISGPNSSEKAYRIGCLRRAVKRLIAQGRYTTKTGKFSTTAACRELSRRKFSASTVVESEIVKEMAGIGDLEGEVVEFRASISRRQMQKLAGMAGWKGPVEQDHDPVADFIEARWRKELREFNRRSELQSRLSRTIGRARAKELIENGVGIDQRIKELRREIAREERLAGSKALSNIMLERERLRNLIEEDDFSQLHRIFLTKGQIMAESNYRENPLRGAYPLFLPFGNIIRQMYYEWTEGKTTLRAGIIPRHKLPKSRRCNHCLKSGHDKRNCPEMASDFGLVDDTDDIGLTEFIEDQTDLETV